MGRIVVSGMGVISPIGDSVAENRQALVNGQSGLSALQMFNSKYANLLPFGEVKTTNTDFRKKLNVTTPGVTRTTLLALHAFIEAVTDSGLSADDLKSFDTAFINGTTVGGMCETDNMYRDANHNETGSEFLSSYELCTVALYIQQRFGINGIVNTLNTACSSSANAIMYGARLIKAGRAKRAIVGGTDSLAKFTINGFNSLNILSAQPCRPFDAERSGLNLGEGAAFIVLEREEDVAANKKVYATVSGYANTNDAFHPSSLSDDGEGPYLAMKQAVEMAGIQPADVSFINTHGTGTENNDEAESKAMLRLFGTPPPFASTKSNIGHTLGAAGGIEAVYAILSLVNQEIYPGLRFSTPIASTGLAPLAEYKTGAVNHVMSNSFGFGGNCSSLVFSKA